MISKLYYGPATDRGAERPAILRSSFDVGYAPGAVLADVSSAPGAMRKVLSAPAVAMGPDPVTPQTRGQLAHSVLAQNLKLRRGEHVLIEAWTHTLPWAVAFARESRRMGAFPLISYEDEGAYWDSVDANEFKVLGKAAAHEWAALAKADVYIYPWAPGDRVRLNALPPAKVDQLFAFNEQWYEVARRAGLRGARLELGRPYPSLARAYGVDEATWTDQLVRATMVSPDALARAGAPLARALAKGRSLRVRDSAGTDLRLGLARRPTYVDVGRPILKDRVRRFQMLTTLPSGAVRLALDETVAEGTLVANRTCFYDDGVATSAVFHFHDGRLKETEFAQGAERFEKGFAHGGVGRDRPGLFSIGLNAALHDTPQLEDLEQGAVMVSVGGNRGFGGKNASGFFGWAVSAGATVEVDGRPISGSG